MAVFVGTSGWSYDDWVGPFYPPGLPDGKAGFLAHYARYFRTVEINSSFYTWPARRTVDSWVERARTFDRFRFSLKLHQSITHEHLVQGEPATVRERTASFHTEVVRPMAAAGLLGAVLIQAPPSFRMEEDRLPLRRLEALLDGLPSDTRPTLELRNRAWVDEGTVAPALLDVLRPRGAAVCITDGPGFPVIDAGTGGHRYLRFHGRNEAAWSAPPSARGPSDAEDHGAARYDYLYDTDELLPWASRIGTEWVDRDTYVYFNNHPYGKAPKNALELMDLLGIPHAPKRVAVPVQTTLPFIGDHPVGYKGYVGGSDPITPHWSRVGEHTDTDPARRARVEAERKAMEATAHPVLRPSEKRARPRVLFLCGANSCRSQMAEGWARHLLGGKVDATSAGVRPGTPNASAVAVMAEAGVDIAHQVPKAATSMADTTYDLVVTLCDEAREECPTFPGPQPIHHRTFADPVRTGRLDDYRAVRDGIRELVEEIPALIERYRKMADH